MAKQKARKKKPIKRKTKKPSRKPSARKRRGAVKTMNDWDNLAANKKAHWTAYQELYAQVQKAWEKFQKDAEKQSFHSLLEDHKHLLLLMGECNYMLNECIRLRDKRSHH